MEDNSNINQEDAVEPIDSTASYSSIMPILHDEEEISGEDFEFGDDDEDYEDEEQDDEDEDDDDNEDEETKQELIRIQSEPDKLVFFHRRVMKIVEHVYPGQWDFRPKREGDGQVNENTYFLLINFPVVHIRNSNQVTHTIEDLYVRINFLGYSFSASSIYGARGKLTTAEYNSNYAHSHLLNTKGFQTFCLGGGTSYSNLVTELAFMKWNQNPEEWEIRFEAFLFQLNAYLSWESIEGIPYRRIAEIGSGNMDNLVERSQINKSRNLFIKFIIDFKEQDLLKFVINNQTSNVELLVTDEIEQLLVISSDIYCYKDHLGNFYSNLSEVKNGKIPEFVPFIFKGKKIEAVFSGIGLIDSRRKYAHRTIVNEIKNELEQKFRRIWFEETFPSYERRSKAIGKTWDAYNSSADVLKDYTVMQSGE